MNYRLGRRRTGRRRAAAIGDLAIPVPFELGAFRASLERNTGAAVKLVSAVMPPGAPSGVFFETGSTRYLCYERDTSPLHQAHIVLSLASHLVLGETSDSPIDRRLVPDLNPQLIRLMLGDVPSRAVAQAEAETFAFVALKRAGAASYPSALAWRALRRLMPLQSALCDAIPEAASIVVPSGRHAARIRLYQRVIEIRDAALMLRPYRDPEVASAAALVARAAGITGDELAATIEAAVLAAAVCVRNAGRPALNSAGSTGVAPALGLGLRSEADWLAAVSRAFARLGQDGETRRRRGSLESAGRRGASRGESTTTAPLNAWSLY